MRCIYFDLRFIYYSLWCLYHILCVGNTKDGINIKISLLNLVFKLSQDEVAIFDKVYSKDIFK